MLSHVMREAAAATARPRVNLPGFGLPRPDRGATVAPRSGDRDRALPAGLPLDYRGPHESPRSPEGEQRRSPEGEPRGAPSLVPELPADMIGRPVPEIGLPSSEGGIFRLRQRVGCGPLVLFFYIRNGTPL